MKFLDINIYIIKKILIKELNVIYIIIIIEC